MKSVQCGLELCSVLYIGEEQRRRWPETTVPTLTRESPDDSHAKTPELRPRNETEGSSVLIQSSVIKNVHMRFGASMKSDCISDETSGRLPGDPVTLRTRQTRCACGQQLGLAEKYMCGACSSTERPSLSWCKGRDMSQWKHLQASVIISFRCVKCAVRLVWDAIT